MKLTDWKSGLPSLEGEYDVKHECIGKTAESVVLRHWFDGKEFEVAVQVKDGERRVFAYLEAYGDTWRGLAEDPNLPPSEPTHV